MNNQSPQDLLSQLSELSNRYYHRELAFEQYRSLRNELLDNINARYNGAPISNTASNHLFN